jgi:hypothetical protein
MSTNKIILEGCIKQYQTENQLELLESELFELFTLTQITKSLNITFENIQTSIVDGSQDGGIDSVFIIVGDEVIDTIDELTDITFTNKTISRFIISQAKKEGSFKESTIDKLITSCPILFDLEKDEPYLAARFNTSLLEKILILRKAWLQTSINGGVIKLDFNYCCIAPELVINAAFQSKVDQLKALAQRSFTGSEIKFSPYSSSELLKLYQTRKPSRLALSFKEQPLSPSYNESGLGFVGTVKLGDYKHFLTDEEGQIREYLFESNIRHFQGLVDVNKNIMETITESDSKDFWWLNNGITIIAENPTQVSKILSIDNVQIVNGLQTSYSIFNNHDGNRDDDRSVLVKVIINNNPETVDKIIASTNSQNQVSASLLRATEDTQRKIELFFLNEGYFYDRRKNYYKNIGKPSSKIFSIQFTAQAIETIGFNSPYSARAKPTSLVKEDGTYHRIFNPSHDFKAYLNCCLILKKTNEFWMNISNSEDKAISSNFKFNIARIATSYIINKANYTFDDISKIIMTTYDQSVFDTSLNIFKQMLSEYHSSNQNINLINTAKSKPFSDFVIAKLHNSFSTQN